MSDDPNALNDIPRDPEEESEASGGPSLRQQAFLEERFAALGPKTSDSEPDIIEGPPAPEAGGLDEPSLTAEETAPPPPDEIPDDALPDDVRQNMIQQYRQRQRSQLAPPQSGEVSDNGDLTPATAAAPLPEAVAPGPAADNWTPIGPSVLRKGQGAVKPATSGRAAGIAVAPGGQRVYVAAANGGVWRSDDAGHHWLPMMEAFDLNPTQRASDSLACGAIAIDPANPDRVYVGSGEGAGGKYFGVGPILSDDGGLNWSTEPVSAGSPPLAGSAFYALAVATLNPDTVVAATRRGIYRREPDGSGGFHWDKKTHPGSTWVTSIVAASSNGSTTYYAAPQSGPVLSSLDGDNWSVLGTDFPSNSVGRISLGVQAGNPDVVYALVARSDNYHLHGVYRLDLQEALWREIMGAPDRLFGAFSFSQGQGWYDQAIAVAPDDVDHIYLGGSTVHSGGDWSGSVFRGEVSRSLGSLSMTAVYIGSSVHADIHALEFVPGDGGQLWLGCDGGVFHSGNPTGSGDIFEARNTGLATLTMNHLAQHPTQESVLFAGTQDNGGVRFTGEEAWLYSSGGDGGFAVINWNDPYKVLSTYTRGSIRRTHNGGERYEYQSVDVPLSNGESVLFYAPLAGAPYNPGSPVEAERVAFGSIRPWISSTFGGSWHSIPDGSLNSDSLGGRIKSLIFASADRLYAGTMNGRVFRFDEVNNVWTRTRLDTLGGSDDLSLSGPITDLAVDPADPDGGSIYLTFGGMGDFRHVWRFDGSAWEARSGPGGGHPDSLLNVQHNAIAVDPLHPTHLYVGADIGVWRSTDSGAAWEPYSEGLPDAGVLDLKLHNEARLLRAATHGRSVFERVLTDPSPGAVELYIRSTQLDLGRRSVVDNLPDPTRKGAIVRRWDAPDIKIDAPNHQGRYQFEPGSEVDFLEFVDALTDEPDKVATHETGNLVNRVYIQIHNRGRGTSGPSVPVGSGDGLRAMLLLAARPNGTPPLPNGYTASLQAGTAIENEDWRTVGIAVLGEVRAGFPEVASFDLKSSALPRPSELSTNDQYVLLALLHHPADPFTSDETDLDALCIAEPRAAYKRVRVVAFSGTLPDAAPGENAGCLEALLRLFGGGG